MSDQYTDAAEALAAIERTQQRAYADQRLPVWYLPGVVALGTAAAVATELDGAAQAAVTGVAVAGLLGLVYALSARTRIKFRPRTWTPKAAAVMALWIASIFAVWGVVPLAAGLATGSGVWQKVLAGAVTAAYSAATLRRAEDMVFARLAGKVVR
ncbi:hypothetical protein SAMN05443665_102544 [Actinomadura meyerae]|jgi:membrane associated rhomboid family serine protease|uniref:Uncharacterized protein n=1 Tax=Actinomadura meyerae TaxID=240840 RepID=A0A239M156_9ACTN|nr:hypothetical protein [Actinomadura meyerae]SNT36032.1 hypothetical protein SAMN05443665_102544 [Actinomadura meyerae]